MARSPTSSAPRGRIATFFRWFLALAALGLIMLGIAVAVAEASLPSYAELTKRNDLGQMIRVRAADGSVLVSMGPSYGRWLPYDQIPETMKRAMVSVEDKRFREHPGIDPIGIARSLKVRLQTGHFSQGGSTITQQLARNIFLTNKRNFGRKLREAVLALALEWKFSKDQILELYLNRVYFGGGSYGIDAASRTFFGHGADQMSLGEAAIVAGLVKAPSSYAPTADVEAARGRAGVVINQMVQNGFLTPAEAASADPAQIKLTPPAKQNSARYFVDWALPQLDTLIEPTNDPIDVFTTLDPRMQGAADKAINANAPAGTQGALVSIDRDGAVRAMVGGRDYVSSIYNRATQAQRQPGSSFKLFVYLSALEAGMKPTDVMDDKPVTIDGWSPRNSTRSFIGPVPLREAFARSINTISAQIGEQVGFPTIAGMAHRFGITSNISTFPSMVLGVSDVRLIEMVRAFASVGANGINVTPYGITKVVTADGRLLYAKQADSGQVLVAPYVAAGMTDLLQTAVMSGTGRAAQIGRPVAGKTGTTSSNKDGWFIGFSSGLTTGVWFGRDDNRTVRGLQGATAPARAFHDYMVVAVANRPVEQFTTEVPLPDWQLSPDEEAWGNYDANGMMVDADGNPLPDPGNPPLPPEQQGQQQQQQQPGPPLGNPGDQRWLDDVLNRPAQPQPRAPQQQAPPPQSAPPPSGQPEPAQ